MELMVKDDNLEYAVMRSLNNSNVTEDIVDLSILPDLEPASESPSSMVRKTIRSLDEVMALDQKPDERNDQKFNDTDVIPSLIFVQPLNVDDYKNSTNNFQIKINTNGMFELIKNEEDACSDASNPITKHVDNDDKDDDVIFVTEYSADQNPEDTPKSSTTTNDENQQPVETEQQNKNKAIRRRRRRRPFGERRKNPVRKAQLDKASADLIEKLSIPPSVFTARIKNKKAKEAVNVEQKAVRQSCRNIGAVFNPPSPLKKRHYKKWPESGMHEKPFYDETLSKTDVEERLGDDASPRKAQKSDQFAQFAHHRLHNLLDYAREIKEFYKLIDPTSDFNVQDGIQKVADLIEDACVLYQLANDISGPSLANYITSLTNESDNFN